MARSTYIYVVTNENGTIVGAYTVKHELGSALRRHPNPGRLTFTRVRDGYLPGSPTELELAQVIEA